MFARRFFVRILTISLIRIVSPTIGMLHDRSQNNVEVFIFLQNTTALCSLSLHVSVGIFVKDFSCVWCNYFRLNAFLLSIL